MLKNILTKVREYIDVTLSTPHPRLGDLPICPYASQYRDSTIILEGDSRHIHQSMDSITKLLHRDVQVVVMAFPHVMKNSEPRFARACDRLQSAVWDQGWTVFLDHPENPYPVADVYTSFGLCPLVVVQRTALLEAKRKSLQKTGYYANWSKEQLKDL